MHFSTGIFKVFFVSNLDVVKIEEFVHHFLQ